MEEHHIHGVVLVLMVELPQTVPQQRVQRHQWHQQQNIQQLQWGHIALSLIVGLLLTRVFTQLEVTSLCTQEEQELSLLNVEKMHQQYLRHVEEQELIRQVHGRYSILS
jgi:hypothetical protein